MWDAGGAGCSVDSIETSCLILKSSRGKVVGNVGSQIECIAIEFQGSNKSVFCRIAQQCYCYCCDEEC